MRLLSAPENNTSFFAREVNSSVKSAGVYTIYCDANDRYYVGSSVRVGVRLVQHRNALIRGDHFNRHLQSAFLKYGDTRFLFRLIENTAPDKESILAAERKWIKNLNACDWGFNLMPEANSPIGVIRGERAKENMRLAALKRGIKIATRYALISPGGELVSGVNIAEFCRTRGFSKNKAINFSALNRGQIPSFMGWKSSRPYIKKIKNVGIHYSFTSPDGVVHSGNNIAEFYRKNGLRPQHFSDMMNRGLRSETGWMITPGFVFEKRRSRERMLISPSGEKHSFTSIKDFAESAGLKAKGLSAFLASDQKQFLGWRKK